MNTIERHPKAFTRAAEAEMRRREGSATGFPGSRMGGMGSMAGGAVPSDDRRAGAAKTGRVILVNRFFYPDSTATAQLLHDLASHLAREHRVVVVTGRHRAAGDRSVLPSYEHINGVDVHRVWSISQGSGSIIRRLLAFVLFYPSAFVALVRIARRGDLLITKTDPPLLSVVSVIVGKLRGARAINWLQDLYPEVAMRLGMPLVRGPAGSLLVKIRDWSLRKAHTNVVIGNLMATKVRQHGVEPQDVRVIPNWANDEAIQPTRVSASASRQQWALPDDAFVVGYSGNLGRAHEIETIGGAADRLRHRKDIRFLFVGGGSGSAELQRLVAQTGLSNCTFKPYQPTEMIGDSLAAADVHWISLRPELEGLIVPSKFYGVVAAGRPIIAVSDPEGEVASIVRQSGCGYVVPPGDVERMVEVIEDLAENPEKRRQMGARSREVATGSCSRRNALGQWSSLVHELLVGSNLAARVSQPKGA